MLRRLTRLQEYNHRLRRVVRRCQHGFLVALRPLTGYRSSKNFGRPLVDVYGCYGRAEIQVLDDAWNVIETIGTKTRDRLCELSQADQSIESESGLENRPLGITQRAACVNVPFTCLSLQPSLGG